MFVFIFIAHGVALITRVRLKVVDWVTSINFNKGHLTFNIYLVNAIGLHGPNLISCKQKFRERRKVGRPWLGNNLIIGLKHQTLVLLDRTGTRQQVNQFYQYIPDSRTKIICEILQKTEEYRLSLAEPSKPSTEMSLNMDSLKICIAET